MKIKLTRTDNLFFCSDPHFNHAKLLEYGLDIFYKDVDDMNETIINNWNSVVPKDGVVFVLGDFALCSKTKIHEFLSRLNGTIYFIFGNHDDKKHFDHPKIVKSDNYCVLEVDSQVIIMSHFPFRSWEKRQYDSWNLHGHCHGMLPEDNSKQLDVYIHGHPKLRPFSYLEVKENMKTKVNLKIDSHERRTTFWKRLVKSFRYLFKL